MGTTKILSTWIRWFRDGVVRIRSEKRSIAEKNRLIWILKRKKCWIKRGQRVRLQTKTNQFWFKRKARTIGWLQLKIQKIAFFQVWCSEIIQVLARMTMRMLIELMIKMFWLSKKGKLYQKTTLNFRLKV